MRRLLALALAVALLAVACSSSVDETQEAYCDSAETWVEALAAARALTPTSSGEESKATVDAMRSAFDDLVAASAEYADAKLSEIESALAEFERTMDEGRGLGTDEEAATAREEALEACLRQ